MQETDNDIMIIMPASMDDSVMLSPGWHRATLSAAGRKPWRCVGGGGVEDIEGGPHVWWSPSVSNAVETMAIRTARGPEPGPSAP